MLKTIVNKGDAQKYGTNLSFDICQYSFDGVGRKPSLWLHRLLRKSVTGTTSLAPYLQYTIGRSISKQVTYKPIKIILWETTQS